MKLRVQYMAQLRTVVGRCEESIELPDGSSLAALFSHLAAAHGGRSEPHLLAANGQAQSGLLVVVNGTAKPVREADVTVLCAGDVVVLMPPIAGG
jgi:molybdopterin converting factor small subunit